MKIAVLPGDGIGTEIVAQAVKVLEALRGDGLKIELEYAHIGGAGYDAAGDPFPAATEKLVTSLLTWFKAPVARQKQFAQRLRYGLLHYNSRPSHASGQFNESQ